jgi:hypothetical protein
VKPEGAAGQLLQATCEAIVNEAMQAVDGEPASLIKTMLGPEGKPIGRQMTIDATEGEKGLLNMCRIAVLNPDVAPAGEIVRIEFEHEKEAQFEYLLIYSVQSLRRKNGKYVLLENFLADGPESVRESDYHEVLSEAYAQKTVLSTLRDWARFRGWQLTGGKK